MASHGYLQNADVCARRVLVDQGDHGVRQRKYARRGANRPDMPAQPADEVNGQLPGAFRDLRHLRHERYSRIQSRAT
jgi:hypothetical protein